MRVTAVACQIACVCVWCVCVCVGVCVCSVCVVYVCVCVCVWVCGCVCSVCVVCVCGCVVSELKSFSTDVVLNLSDFYLANWVYTSWFKSSGMLGCIDW